MGWCIGGLLVEVATLAARDGLEESTSWGLCETPGRPGWPATRDTVGTEPLACDPNSPRSMMRVRAADRRRRSLELRAAGLTFQRIGDELGISDERARQLVNEGLEETRLAIAENAEELRTLEAERLDRAAAVLWPRVIEGDLRAHDRWLKNRESYRRLVGLDRMPDAAPRVTVVMGDAFGAPSEPVVDGEIEEVAES